MIAFYFISNAVEVQHDPSVSLNFPSFLSLSSMFLQDDWKRARRWFPDLSVNHMAVARVVRYTQFGVYTYPRIHIPNLLYPSFTATPFPLATSLVF